MKTPPIPVMIVAAMFILAGGIGFVYHLKDLSVQTISLYESLWILFLRLLAVVCGVMLLKRINWARWLAIAWLLYHVIISMLNSTSDIIAHLVFLAIVAVLLFLPKTTVWFKQKNKV